jgi:hypothetical protein
MRNNNKKIHRSNKQNNTKGLSLLKDYLKIKFKIKKNKKMTMTRRKMINIFKIQQATVIKIQINNLKKVNYKN